MRDVLVHRGPDDQGIYLSPNKAVGLGHRRLSIIDLSPAGHQPMSYQDRYWIVYNGELYNFQTLRSSLEKKGHRFHSHTDTEVILAMYAEYGAKCLQHFRGMFAFAIYDEREEILFCARDRTGQKPFKYFFDGNVFLFASELKAILTQSEYHKAPDQLAIHHYLTYQYVPAPRTGFEGIKKLEPAHYLILDIRKKKIEISCYWKPDFINKEDRSEKEWSRLIIDQLSESVAMHMVSDVPLGAFLSGGIDSSAIVALMARHSARPVKTFSIGFPDQEYSELKYARLVAKKFKTDHEEFIVKPNALDILPQLAAIFEEPYADSSAVPTYYLSQLTRQHVTVALNGDGGDENFAGYARYSWHKAALALDRWGISGLPMWTGLASLLKKNITTTLNLRAHRFLESLSEPTMRRYVTYLCYFTNAMKEELYQPAFAASVFHHDSYEIMNTLSNQWRADQVEKSLTADCLSYLPDDLLVKVDMTSMASALEVRSPFLDRKFIELIARIPFPLKLRGFNRRKYIFKKACSSLLPHEITARKKMGFVLPIEKWLRGDMKSYVYSLLVSDNTLITQHYFRPAAVKKLLDGHVNTAANLAPPIWALLQLELWMRHYFP